MKKLRIILVVICSLVILAGVLTGSNQVLFGVYPAFSASEPTATANPNVAKVYPAYSYGAQLLASKYDAVWKGNVLSIPYLPKADRSFGISYIIGIDVGYWNLQCTSCTLFLDPDHNGQGDLNPPLPLSQKAFSVKGQEAWGLLYLPPGNDNGTLTLIEISPG